jgi:hypothetical protein
MASSIPLAQVETKTGAQVRVFDGALWPSLEAQHGVGVMLTIDMPQLGDGRHAEVYLDLASLIGIDNAIGAWLER